MIPSPCAVTLLPPAVVIWNAEAALVMVSVAPVTAPVAAKLAAVAQQGHAAPVMLSEPPDTAPVDNSVAPATVPVVASAAQETASKASTPVVNTLVQFTSLHSSWSQPTLPCAVSPSSVAKPVRASKSASRSVTETEGAGPDLHAAQVQRARRLLHQPGDRATEGSEVPT